MMICESTKVPNVIIVIFVLCVGDSHPKEGLRLSSLIYAKKPFYALPF